MLQYLDLSHNSFGAQGGSALKKMICKLIFYYNPAHEDQDRQVI